MALRIAYAKVRLSEAQAVSVMLQCVQTEFAREGYDTWITSGIDGVHSVGSRHYDDPERDDPPALDFRSKHVPPETMDKIYRRIKQFLLPLFDVIWEARGTWNEHLHIEYHPK